MKCKPEKEHEYPPDWPEPVDLVALGHVNPKGCKCYIYGMVGVDKLGQCYYQNIHRPGLTPLFVVAANHNLPDVFSHIEFRTDGRLAWSGFGKQLQPLTQLPERINLARAIEAYIEDHFGEASV